VDDHQGIVLLDVPPGHDGEFDRTTLEAMDHPVLVCHGPSEDECPLVSGRGCRKFHQAHGVVFKLDLGRPEHRRILQRYSQLAREGTPIRVLVGPDDEERYTELLRGVETWTHEPNVADLDGFAAEVEAADRLR
jgi:hypothetical protein